MSAPRKVVILGSTGSIGVNTLDVVARHPDRFRIFALSGASQIDKLAEQCRQFRVAPIATYNVGKADRMRSVIESHSAARHRQFAEVEGVACAARASPYHRKPDLRCPQ